jgi:nicotinate-nucleotide adenylyltransferase
MAMCGNELFAGAVGILGGTFNPVHVGHLRMAIEVRENLGLRRVLFLPSFAPPHKSDHALLPYSLRVSLVKAACEGEAGLGVSEEERFLATPSYTVRTVVSLRQRPEDGPWVLIVGSTDFVSLPSWHQGTRLPHLVDMVVVERGGTSWAEADHFARVALGLTRTAWGWYGKRRIVYLQAPLLAISSSMVRERFVTGRSVRGLIPDACFSLLEQHRTFIERLWRKELQ